ncbi:MAG: hypothetical protein J6K82_01690, partial [Alphaproteobacteria bacterium]|nr:hypothetical protein [Alphaproteobacteria bacterium]
MKKLLFLPILTLACFATLSNSWGATYNCSYVKNSELANDEDGNNFLYLNTADMNSNQSFFCGEKGDTGCNHAQYIRIIGTPYMDGNNATGFHAFRCNHRVKGNPLDKRAWQHNTDVEDILTCSDIDGKTLIATLDGMNYYTDTPDNWQKYNDTTWYSKKWVSHRDFDGLCRIESESANEENPPVVPEESSLEKCLKNRRTKEGIACCYLSSSVAKYNFQTQKCECKNGGTFEIATNGRGGTCKVSGGDGDDGSTPPDGDESTSQPVVTETYKCDPTKLAFISK